MVSEHGAFELCLPSLGFLFTKLTLRLTERGQPHRMIKVGTAGTSVGLEHRTVNALYVQADPGSEDDNDDPDDHMLSHISRYLQTRLVTVGNDLQ